MIVFIWIPFEGIVGIGWVFGKIFMEKFVKSGKKCEMKRVVGFRVVK